MKSRLITALAIGALAAGLLPGVASATPNLACAVDGAPNSCAAETEVTITVTEGTTIVAPALVSIGSAFPGQMATSSAQTISWWSNQQGMTIFADLDSDPFIDGNGDHNIDEGEAYFAAGNVELGSDDTSYYDAVAFDEMRPFNTNNYGVPGQAVPVQDITFSSATIEEASSGQFKLEVHVPQATEGNYEAWMTYSVQSAF